MKLSVERTAFGLYSWEVERDDGVSVSGYEHQLEHACEAAIRVIDCPVEEVESDA